jgi:hypothetical protein
MDTRWADAVNMLRDPKAGTRVVFTGGGNSRPTSSPAR